MKVIILSWDAEAEVLAEQLEYEALRGMLEAELVGKLSPEEQQLLGK